MENRALGPTVATEAIKLLYVNRVINYQDGSGVHGSAFFHAFAKQADIITYPHAKQIADIPWHRTLRIPRIKGVSIDHLFPTPFEAILAIREMVRSLRDHQHIKQMANDWQPDWFLVRQQGVDFVATLLANRGAIPVALEVNAPLALEVKTERPSGLLDIYSRSEKMAWRKSQAIFVVSNVLRDILADAGVFRDKIIVNPNGVDEVFFDPDRITPQEARAGLHLPSSVRAIGFVGSLRPWHGLDNLMAAFDQLLATNYDANLFIVGDGPERKKIERWIAQNGLTNRVVIAGHVAHKDLPAWISAMDVCVAPYPPLDPFYFSPLKVLEYMAMAKPIVGSGIGQVSELLNGGAGFLVTPGNIHELYAALKYVLEHPDSGELAGRKAREKILKSYTWTHNARRVEQILTSFNLE